MLVLALLALLAVAQAARLSVSSHDAARAPSPLTLQDRPIVGSSYTSLDGEWQLTNNDYHISGRVPGDLISDLFAAQLLPEPLFENNFLLNATLWNDETWTYQRVVTLTAAQVERLRAPDGDAAGDVWLVLDGIKMGANIILNGALLAVSRHQFLRQELSLRAAIRSVNLNVTEGDNLLQVQFDPDINEYGQFMECSGGWDWAPVSHSVTHHTNLGAYSRGIWKSVYLLDVDTLAITAMTAHTTYTGAFPTTPLQPHKHADFLVNVTVFLAAPKAVEVQVTATGSWQSGFSKAASCSVPAGNSSCVVQLTASADQIDLWWSVNRGAQPLYNVTVSVSLPSQPSASPLSSWRRVGFRVFHIVTGNDTDPTWVQKHAGDDGSATQGLRYRINGEPIFARGANMIPIDSLEGRYRAETLRRVILSAAEAGMNLVRVWAGGIWQNDVFYDTADEAGVMIYHDQVNRGQVSGRPEELPAYSYQLRRLSSHPSIVAWNGCNECLPWLGGGIEDLVNFVVQHDSSRPVWPACPSEGWTSGVNKLTGLPNGNGERLVMAPVALPWGPMDTHGPYQHGDGFPAVNGDIQNLNLFDPMTPSVYDPSVPIGPLYNHTFTSEFGAVTWSSFESLSATFAPEHWSLHGGSAPDNCTGGFFQATVCNGSNVVAQRNYPCDSIVLSYWGGKQSQLDAVGAAALQQQLFKCLTGSALIVKGYVEQHRATNTFGLMVWQLNEIWPTGGWGSLEYGWGDFPGQVVGGRWKPTHYWLQHSLFTDLMVSCGRQINATDDQLLCYVKLDAYQPDTTQYTVVVEQYQLADSSKPRRLELPVALPPGPGSIHWFYLNGSWSSTSSILQLSVTSPHSTPAHAALTTNFYLPAAPYQLALPAGDLGLTYDIVQRGEDEAVIVVYKKDAGVGLFFTLTTLAAGRFSRNAFHLVERTTNVTFIPFGKLDLPLLKRSLRWEHANLYTQQQPQQQLPATSRMVASE